MDDTTFAKLAELSEHLEQTRKRGELTGLLAGFLRTLSPAEIPLAARLAIGQI